LYKHTLCVYNCNIVKNSHNLHGFNYMMSAILVQDLFFLK